MMTSSTSIFHVSLRFIADDVWKNERDDVVDWLLEEKIRGNDF